MYVNIYNYLSHIDKIFFNFKNKKLFLNNLINICYFNFYCKT